MFKFLRKKQTFDDAKKDQFCEAVGSMLEAQMATAAEYPIEDSQGHLNRKALGYVYGFIDAALRTVGQDMSDRAISVPITYRVLRLFPGRADHYMQYLIDGLGKDDLLMLGVVMGGQQYLEFNKPGATGIPMGLARLLLEEATAQS